MNAVNNGPTVKKPGGDQKRGNFEDYKAARISFARTHDAARTYTEVPLELQQDGSAVFRLMPDSFALVEL